VLIKSQVLSKTEVLHRGTAWQCPDHGDDDDGTNQGDDKCGQVKPCQWIWYVKQSGGQKATHQGANDAQDNIPEHAMPEPFITWPANQPAIRPRIHDRIPILFSPYAVKIWIAIVCKEFD
jgi:hypothetical protein